eukprot:12827122-Alexandrium_andersonii.AAC.1
MNGLRPELPPGTTYLGTSRPRPFGRAGMPTAQRGALSPPGTCAGWLPTTLAVPQPNVLSSSASWSGDGHASCKRRTGAAIPPRSGP